MHCLTGLSPPVKYFTDRSKAVLLLWIFYGFFSVLCLLCLCMRLFICALWSPAGKGLTSWLSFVMSNCPIDILGQVWNLILSIPDLCTPTYFPYQQTIMGYLCPPAKSHLNGVSLADRYSPVFFLNTLTGLRCQPAQLLRLARILKFCMWQVCAIVVHAQ